VESDQIIALTHCDGSDLMPASMGRTADARHGMGTHEAPLSVATVRPDGTMVALRQGEHNAVRLFWCRVTMARQCEWGGAATLYQMPAWSLTVATTPDGGVVAGVIAPAKDPLRGEILLLTCRDLACAEPHVSMWAR
jgi:hypothetical protein